MSEDRITVPVRLTPQQHELLRRRSIADQVTMQTVLSAAANAYILGDLKVRANGRYFVSAPTVPASRDDEVRLRAPSDDDPQRTVTLSQPPAEGSSQLGSPWLVEHLHRRCGKQVSPRMLRKFLAHAEQAGIVEPREGRYWRFTGADDPNVVAVRIALDDGTWDAFAMQQVEQARGAGEELE